MLTEDQKTFYDENGYLLVEDAVTPDQLKRLREITYRLIDGSRGVTESNEVYDLDKGHSADTPRLTRVKLPHKRDPYVWDLIRNSKMTEVLTDLLGPHTNLLTSKLNTKAPGGGRAVEWHQDWAFYPHTNDDMLAFGVFLEDVTEENGPLEVLPGSHKGEIHGLWHNGIFTGAVTQDVADESQSKAVVCTGKAGSVCLMHTRLLHGSTPNLSRQSRTLFICVYSAEDAIPCSPNPVPTKFQGLLVKGEKTNKVRSMDFQIDLPQLPSTASFFDQQANDAH